MITDGELTWQIDNEGYTSLLNCNPHEADTRIILHALNSEDEVIVVANDTDVLILLVYAYALHRLSRQWKIKVDTNRYIDIKTIVENYGLDVCLVFPAYHSITGCDHFISIQSWQDKAIYQYGKKKHVLSVKRFRKK